MLRIAACVVFAGVSTAQNHLRVPQQFSQISAAIAAAQPGDIIWVSPTYGSGPIVINKPLSILGLGTGHFQMPGIWGSGTAIDIRVGADDMVVIAGFGVGNQGGSPTVNVRGGRVLFEDCLISSPLTGSQVDLVVVADADVAFMRTQVSGQDGTALRARNSRISALSTSFFVGPYSHASAVALTASSLHGNGVTVSSSAAAIGVGWPGLIADAQSRVWLTDSNLAGGSGNPNGAGLTNLAAVPAELRNTSLVGGSIGLVNLAAPLLGAAQTWPSDEGGSLRLGATTTFDFQPSPGSPVLVMWSEQAARAYATPWVAQPIRLPATAGFVAATSGNFTLAVAVPNAPTLLGRALWIHGFSGLNAPLQAAPLMGGVLRN